MADPCSMRGLGEWPMHPNSRKQRLDPRRAYMHQLLALRSLHLVKAQPVRLAGPLIGIIADNPTPPGQIV